ncbi:MAG: response regulator [Lachnospiraceae bacterium]|nr:response regulator [Lachnospiraceae bacterium]
MTILELLDELQVDKRKLLNRFSGMETLLCRLIRSFPEESKYDELQKKIKEKNYEAAADIAHGMKGVASNLELDVLESELQKLIEDLRMKKQLHISIQFSKIQKEYMRIINVIKLYMQNNINILDYTGKRILLADDMQISGVMIQERTKLKGGQVDLVYDGEEALQMFLTHGTNYYQAVLLDLCMPKMNGNETLEAIRKRIEYGGDRIPVIALSANAFKEDRERSLSLGFTEHIGKPIDFNQLDKILVKLWQ